MPRPKKPGAPEPKRRSRNGCWPCKARKVKCGEEKPSCVNCARLGETCDYSIRLNWEGRIKKSSQNVSSAATGDPFRMAMVTVPKNTAAPTKAAAPTLPQNHTGADLAYQSIPNNTPTGPETQVAENSFVGPASSDEDAFMLSASSIQTAAQHISRQPHLPAHHPGTGLASNGSQEGQPPKRVKLTSAHNIAPVSANENTTAPTYSRGGPHDKDIPTSPTETVQTTTSDEAASVQSAHGHGSSMADVQRVSVQSLLSPPATMQPPSVKSPSSIKRVVPNGSSQGNPDIVNYGYDCGRHDYDLNKNDDFSAIQREIPIESPTDSSDSQPRDREKTVTVFAKGGYYARPVPINLPRHLTPLPSTVVDNPIHLLYFHHFMNHTAKILVPHVCPNNPFESVLPAMALKDENVLNMLFAYSASHRARLLGHAEPYSRIAYWTRYVFTDLRKSLDHPKAKVSDTNLAAAIMLVSLKIISPTTFEAPIPWQDHLKLARELFVARSNVQQIFASNKVGSFLGRWLSYLDIMGSLSSADTEPPLFGGNYWSTEPTSDGQESVGGSDLEIDCFSGFTPRCRSLLARLAELTHKCEPRPAGSGPSPVVLSQAEQLLLELKDMGSLGVRMRRSHHSSDSGMTTIDDAYRLAGVVHLYRRIFGWSASDAKVRDAVAALVDTINRVPRGGSGEVCCLFPIFTAGCETEDRAQRQEIHSRVKSFEGVGMKQIRRARKLMQRTWQENLPWTELANGEFLG